MTEVTCEDRCGHGIRCPHPCDECDDDALKPHNLVKQCLDQSDQVERLAAENAALRSEIADAYAAGKADERERVIAELRDDARQTEVEARRVLGNLINRITRADIEDWGKLIAMKHAIADMLEERK